MKLRSFESLSKIIKGTQEKDVLVPKDKENVPPKQAAMNVRPRKRAFRTSKPDTQKKPGKETKPAGATRKGKGNRQSKKKEKKVFLAVPSKVTRKQPQKKVQELEVKVEKEKPVRSFLRVFSGLGTEFRGGKLYNFMKRATFGIWYDSSC
jgi:FtsZ-interacting cell division protein ZipA